MTLNIPDFFLCAIVVWHVVVGIVLGNPTVVSCFRHTPLAPDAAYVSVDADFLHKAT